MGANLHQLITSRYHQDLNISTKCLLVAYTRHGLKLQWTSVIDLPCAPLPGILLANVQHAQDKIADIKTKIKF